MIISVTAADAESIGQLRGFEWLRRSFNGRGTGAGHRR
jgi:hypothetical protein